MEVKGTTRAGTFLYQQHKLRVVTYPAAQNTQLLPSCRLHCRNTGEIGVSPMVYFEIFTNTNQVLDNTLTRLECACNSSTECCRDLSFHFT